MGRLGPWCTTSTNYERGDCESKRVEWKTQKKRILKRTKQWKRRELRAWAFENKDLLAMGLKDNQTALLCSRMQIMSLCNKPNNGRGENWEHELLRTKIFWPWDSKTTKQHSFATELQMMSLRNVRIFNYSGAVESHHVTKVATTVFIGTLVAQMLNTAFLSALGSHNLLWKSIRGASSQQCTDTIPNLEKKCPSWKLITTQPTNPCFDRCQTAETPCPCC
jgi:hypothetical protein